MLGGDRAGRLGTAFVTESIGNMTSRERSHYDPRESWTPLLVVFLLALVLVVDDARPGGYLDGGLWIPVLYAVAPVVCGLMAYVRTRAASGRPLRPVVVLGVATWGVIGALAALVIVVVIGLGRPPGGIPSAASDLLRGLLTYLVQVGVFVGCYGEAGRRQPTTAGLLIVATPVVVATVLGLLVWATW